MTLDSIRQALIAYGVQIPIAVSPVDEKKYSTIFITTQIQTDKGIAAGGVTSYEIARVQVVYRGAENKGYPETEAAAVAALPQIPVRVTANGSRYRMTPLYSGFISSGLQNKAYEAAMLYEILKQ